MFGLFFIVGIPLALYFYVRFAIKISLAWDFYLKIPFFVIAFGLPISCPFAYKYTDNYKNFMSLCAAERVTVFKSKSVNVYNDGYYQSGYAAVLAKPYKSFVTGNKVYTPQSNFKSDECKTICAIDTKKCLTNQCMAESEISSSTIFVKFASLHSSTDFVGAFNTLLRTSLEQLVGNDNELYARRYDYTFYPYGTGWAVILGAASGSAPSQSCSQFSRFNFYEITPPMN
jgi:hypothetical protein